MPPQQSVLITGCSANSIGSSIALSFASRGFLVFATLRNTSKIAPELASLSNVEVLALDTTSLPTIRAAADAVSKRTGGTLDYLVNNAGLGLVRPFLDTDLEEARKLFEVNFWGVLMCVQEFKGLLVEARGTVVNVASIAGVAPNPYESIYNASKAALIHHGETIRHELKPLGVSVVTVMAGMVQSAWYSNVPGFRLPEGSYYHPVKQQIQDGVTGTDNKKNGTKVDVFGEDVVKKVLRKKTGLIWAGALSGLIWWAMYLPTAVMDKIAYDRAGLAKLEDARRGAP